MKSGDIIECKHTSVQYKLIERTRRNSWIIESMAAAPENRIRVTENSRLLNRDFFVKVPS